ncbi:MAG: HAD family hydrolase [Verrucomicrobiales bacterium]|nr:HAD family hydrolase [Verrucomicrobiales bacterium]
MSVRAVIFDVYQTLLEVGPPPLDADARWRALWARLPENTPPPTLAAFAAACEAVIRHEHALAREQGVACPEVYWPAVTAAAAPALRALDPSALDDWLFAHAQLVRTVRLAPHAGHVLRRLVSTGLALGIASNAQPYTWRELEEVLQTIGLDRACFDPALCFGSFEQGFSKPDPHVFRLLSARLRARGISPDETLMVGDRLDNDIAPARRAGWQAWHLRRSGKNPAELAGDWPALELFLAQTVAGYSPDASQSTS